MKYIYLILALVCLQANAFHKDRLVYETYGNVKVLAKVPFYECALASKSKVIGQLAAKLSEKLKYNDTIYLYFKSRYDRDPLTILNKNYYDKQLNIFEIYSYHYGTYKINHPHIALKKITNDSKVTDILQLLHYAITNNLANDTQTYEQHLYDEEDKLLKTDKFPYYGLSAEAIDAILAKPLPKLVQKVLKAKAVFLEKDGVQLYFENNAYYISNGKVTFKAENLVQTLKGSQGLFLFYQPDAFVYLNSETATIQQHTFTTLKKNVTNETFTFNYPFVFEGSYNYYTRTKNPEGISFYPIFRRGYWFEFSELTNEIVREAKH